MNLLRNYRRAVLAFEWFAFFVLGLIAFHENEIIYLMFALVILCFTMIEMQVIWMLEQYEKINKKTKK